MTVTVNIFVALLVALGVAVGVFLVGGNHEENARRVLASAEVALTSVPDPVERAAADRVALRFERGVGPVCRLLVRHVPPAQEPLVRATALRMSLAARLAPLGAAMLALGVIAGFLRRDRARELLIYSSVTFSYAGKVLALGAMAWFVFVAVCPFAPPIWTLYVASVAAGVGAAVYVGNLPPRL